MNIEYLRHNVCNAPLIFRENTSYFCHTPIEVRDVAEYETALHKIYEENDLVGALEFAYKYMPFEGCVAELAAYLFNEIAERIQYPNRIWYNRLNSVDSKEFVCDVTKADLLTVLQKSKCNELWVRVNPEQFWDYSRVQRVAMYPYDESLSEIYEVSDIGYCDMLYETRTVNLSNYTKVWERK